MKSHRQLVSGVHNLPKHRMVFILMNKPTLKLTPPNIFILHIVISNLNRLQLHYGIVCMRLFIMWQRFHYRSLYYWRV